MSYSGDDDDERKISEVTRRAIIDHINVANINWAGVTEMTTFSVAYTIFQGYLRQTTDTRRPRATSGSTLSTIQTTGRETGYFMTIVSTCFTLPALSFCAFCAKRCILSSANRE